MTQRVEHQLVNIHARQKRHYHDHRRAQRSQNSLPPPRPCAPVSDRRQNCRNRYDNRDYRPESADRQCHRQFTCPLMPEWPDHINWIRNTDQAGSQAGK